MHLVHIPAYVGAQGMGGGHNTRIETALFFCSSSFFFRYASSSSQCGFSAHFAQCSYAPAAVQEIEIYTDAAGAVQHSQQLHMLHGTSSGTREYRESAIALSARPFFFFGDSRQCARPTRNKEATRFTLNNKNYWK